MHVGSVLKFFYKLLISTYKHADVHVCIKPNENTNIFSFPVNKCGKSVIRGSGVTPIK